MWDWLQFKLCEDDKHTNKRGLPNSTAIDKIYPVSFKKNAGQFCCLILWNFELKRGTIALKAYMYHFKEMNLLMNLLFHFK